MYDYARAGAFSKKNVAVCALQVIGSTPSMLRLAVALGAASVTLAEPAKQPVRPAPQARTPRRAPATAVPCHCGENPQTLCHQ